MDRIGNGLQLGCEEERAISKRESQVSVMHIGMDSGTIHRVVGGRDWEQILNP